MNPTEATTNIIVTMINNKLLTTSEDISQAYKTIFAAVRKPEEI